MLDGNDAGNGNNGKDKDKGKTPGQQTPPPGGQTPAWEQVLAGLPDEHRQLYQDHMSGLQNALTSERQANEELTNDLRKVRDQLKKGTPERQVLDKAIEERDAAMQRADFIAEAVKPEIGCNDPALAYLAAVNGGFIDGRGRINWERLKAGHPTLFGQPKPAAAHGGAGTGGQPPAGAKDMNAFIRKSAGRQ